MSYNCFIQQKCCFPLYAFNYDMLQFVEPAVNYNGHASFQ